MRIAPLLLPMKIGALLLANMAAAIDIDINSQESIIAATKIASKKLRALYPDKEPWFVAGEFGQIASDPTKGYYWWEGGAAMGAWVDYWALTGDDSYNDIVTEGLLNQVGDGVDYEPAAQTLSLGNDDQAFWGIAAMAAAERGFPNPPKNKPQWLALAQAVFNRQAGRWDTKNCNGGLRWQIPPTNKGYDYKNSVSNGLLFHLGARLARYTGNSTYADWAERTYKWTMDMGLISKPDYRIYDGAHIPECVVSSKIQWTYNAGIYLSGAAYLYDYYRNETNTAKMTFWETETHNLLNGTNEPFFNADPKYAPLVMQESACEFGPTCNIDQRSFKAYLSRFMGQTMVLVNSTQGFIMDRLKASAVAVGKVCTGPPDGQTCGLQWRQEKFDGSPYGIAIGGVGEHMAAMELFQTLLVPLSVEKATPLTKVRGTSPGDPSAGSNEGSNDEDLKQAEPTTTGDRAGAGILTTICLGSLLGLTYWLIRE